MAHYDFDLFSSSSDRPDTDLAVQEAPFCQSAQLACRQRGYVPAAGCALARRREDLSLRRAWRIYAPFKVLVTLVMIVLIPPSRPW